MVRLKVLHCPLRHQTAAGWVPPADCQVNIVISSHEESRNVNVFTFPDPEASESLESLCSVTDCGYFLWKTSEDRAKSTYPRNPLPGCAWTRMQPFSIRGQLRTQVDVPAMQITLACGRNLSFSPQLVCFFCPARVLLREARWGSSDGIAPSSTSAILDLIQTHAICITCYSLVTLNWMLRHKTEKWDETADRKMTNSEFHEITK